MRSAEFRPVPPLMLADAASRVKSSESRDLVRGRAGRRLEWTVHPPRPLYSATLRSGNGLFAANAAPRVKSSEPSYLA